MLCGALLSTSSTHVNVKGCDGKLFEPTASKDVKTALDILLQYTAHYSHGFQHVVTSFYKNTVLLFPF